MKIGIIGDTHGSKRYLEKIYGYFKGVDFLVHTGDHWKDACYLEEKYKLPVLTVRGNCDLSNFPTELTFKIEEKVFYVTHGHQYSVKYGLQRLYYRACELNAAYCIFGHTHIPVSLQMNKIMFLNPGSLVWPRGREKYAGIMLENCNGRFYDSFIETGE